MHNIISHSGRAFLVFRLPLLKLNNMKTLLSIITVLSIITSCSLIDTRIGVPEPDEPGEGTNTWCCDIDPDGACCEFGRTAEEEKAECDKRQCDWSEIFQNCECQF